MRKSLSIVAMTLGVAGAVAGMSMPAFSQALSYLPRRLTSSDMAVLRAEAAKLGPNGPKQEGWHNPKTGNSGVVTFLKASEHEGRPCREFRYTFRTGTPQDGLPYKLKWCETQSNTWKIAN
ncbi:MAG: hypothetical protein HIU92_14410 [Proteobacteria bacterium]|nr:hypothetical protein [Pseudomonadota bacterium]